MRHHGPRNFHRLDPFPEYAPSLGMHIIVETTSVRGCAYWGFQASVECREALLPRSLDFLAGRWDTLLGATRAAAAAPRAGSAADVR